MEFVYDKKGQASIKTPFVYFFFAFHLVALDSGRSRE